MSPIVAGAGVDLEYEERGAGACVLLVHDMAADAATMLQAVPGIEEIARVVAYSRRGYAGSGAPEPYAGTTVQEQAEDAAAVLRSLAPGGAIIVGAGFGALIALDLLLRHPTLAPAAVLSDTPLLALVPDAARALAEQREELEEAVRQGGPEAGVARWLGGSADGERIERAQRSAGAFFADYAGLASWPVTRRELRELGAPIVVLSGPATPPHVLAASDALAALLPAAARRTDGDLAGAVSELVTRA